MTVLVQDGLTVQPSSTLAPLERCEARRAALSIYVYAQLLKATPERGAKGSQAGNSGVDYAAR